MSGPIWDEGDETTVRSAGGMALAQQFADLVNHGQVGLLVVPADIVRVAEDAAGEDQVQSPHMIFDIKAIADISIASSYDLYNDPREVQPKMLPMFTTKGVFNAQSNDRRRRRLALRRPLFALKITGVCVASARFRGF